MKWFIDINHTHPTLKSEAQDFSSVITQIAKNIYHWQCKFNENKSSAIGVSKNLAEAKKACEQTSLSLKAA